ncbi:MAG: hypothetical protein QOI67_106 [Gaiellaceae bacterium]|nr:hypothetical protein [Gaiellaceae bacterium]
MRAQIALEVDREFSQLERARRAAHVAQCAECAEFGAEVREFTRLLREAPPELLQRQISVRRPRTATRSVRLSTVAAAAMVFALVGLTSQVASQLARSDLAAARSGPTVYPNSSDLESEIAVIEALAASPRLMADNANLR